MPALQLDNVPEELYRRIEQLAAVEQVPLATEALHLLQEAVRQKPRPNGGSPPERLQRAVLDDIIRHRFAPRPGMPSVVEMLREDRER